MNIDRLFEFEEQDAGYILKKYLLENDRSVTDVEIPSEYKGKPVIGIGDYAFFNAYFLNSVRISEGVEKIGHGAFDQCDDLKTVILPDSLTVIESVAFQGCTKLENISFPRELKVIGELAFDHCGIRSLVLPAGLEELGRSAFVMCLELRSVVLPEKLKVIRNRTFLCCVNLESIEFSEGLKKIGELAFYKCGFKTLTFPSSLNRSTTRHSSTAKSLKRSIIKAVLPL